MGNLFTRLKKECLSLYDSPSEKNELFFFILFGFYEAFNFFLKIRWNDTLDVDYIRIAFVEIIMLGAAVYFVVSIADWKHLADRHIAVMIAAGLGLMAIGGYLSTRLSTNAFGVIFDMYFCLMVIGKDYKKILRNTMWIGICTIAFCAIGLPLGITKDIVKPNNSDPGHSLGTVYPNTWGYLVFLILLILWYLYLRKRTIKHLILTFAVFWGASAFMYFYICCHTIAGLTIVFPIFAALADWLEKKADLKAEEELKRAELEAEKKRKEELERKKSHQKGKKGRQRSAQEDVKQEEAVLSSHTPHKHPYFVSFLKWLVVFIPYLSFAFVMFVSTHYEWVHKHFYGHHSTKNLALRFMQGGMYFAVYGIPMVGNPYDSRNIGYVDINGEFFQVGILDSSFASYIIMRGLLWVLLCMTWLCAANWKAIKKRDFAIPVIGLFILGYAMMERPGLELWYNFILLYPLVKAGGKQGRADGDRSDKHERDTGRKN